MAAAFPVVLRALPHAMPLPTAEPAQRSAHRRVQTAVVIFIVILGTVFRLFFIGASDLWLDEIWSVNAAAANRPAGAVVATALGDAHPPLYDLLLHGWLCITPDVPTAGRYLSLIFGIAGMGMTHHCVRRISGSWSAALFALALLALNHFHAAYSIEARYYALVYCLALGTTAHLILFLRDASRRDLIFFAGHALALLYTHIYGAFLLFALSLSVLLLVLLRRVAMKQFLGFCTAGAALGLLYAPFLIRVFQAPTHPNVAWMKLASPGVFFEYLYNYSNKNPIEALATALPLLLYFRIYKSAPVAAVLTVGSVALTFLTAYALSVLRQPLLHERYTMVYFPGLVILAAIFWHRVLRERGKALLILGSVVAISSAVNLRFVNPFGERLRHEPWRLVAETLRDLPPGRTAAVYAEEPQYINYYCYRAGGPLVRPVSERGVEPEFWYFQTEYDRQAVPGHEVLEEIERIGFQGRFALVRYAAKR